VRPDRNAAPIPLIEYDWISLLDHGKDLAAGMVELCDSCVDECLTLIAPRLVRRRQPLLGESSP
jgi:hypothetical protein